MSTQQVKSSHSQPCFPVYPLLLRILQVVLTTCGLVTVLCASRRRTSSRCVTSWRNLDIPVLLSMADYLQVCILMYARAHICLCMHMHTHGRACMQACTLTRMQAHTHTRTHAHTRTFDQSLHPFLHSSMSEVYEYCVCQCHCTMLNKTV